MQDFEQIRCLSQVAASRQTARRRTYVVSQPSLKENSYLSYIWVLEDGISRKLTAGGRKAAHVAGRPDAAVPRRPQCLYGKKGGRTGNNRLQPHQHPRRRGGTGVHHPDEGKRSAKVDDTHFLFIGNFDHYRPDLSGLQGEELEQAKQVLEEEKDYEVFDELPFWSNGFSVSHGAAVASTCSM